MYKKQIALLLTLLIILTSFVGVYADVKTDNYGEVAYQHLVNISDGIGARVTGTANCVLAKEYITEEFEKIGYEVALQDFTFTRGSNNYSSTNVIAIKPGRSNKQIIVGGHYDSVKYGKGADDSASGIATILEVAKWIKDVNTPYSIKFIAFGAEENGLKGSAHYTSQMTQEEINNTVMMVNLDSLAVGDKMYVYGDGDKDGWFRDKVLKIAKRLNLDVETNPGLNPDYPVGTTGDWSDHAAFIQKGIPYMYFEATNWELGELDGYTQTEEDGEIWHTANDTISYIEENYPGRTHEHLATFVQVLEEILRTSRNSTPGN